MRRLLALATGPLAPETLEALDSVGATLVDGAIEADGLGDGVDAILVLGQTPIAGVDLHRLLLFHRGHEGGVTVFHAPGGGDVRVLSANAYRAGGAPNMASVWRPPTALPPSRPAVFLDRDGTIIEEVHYLNDPGLVRLIPGAPEALARLASAGFALVVVSNQSGVGRGRITPEQLAAVDSEMDRQLAEQGARIDARYACTDAPNDPREDPPFAWRGRRKPGPGMLCEAAAAGNLDLSRSWIVGDMLRDLLAGRNAGCPGLVLVRTGKGLTQETLMPELPRLVADDLATAADLILAGAT